MQTLTVKQISNLDSPALTAVIDYWKNYDQKSVLLTYAELKKRGYVIPEKLMKKQNEFCAEHNYDTIDTFLHTFFKKYGYNFYTEYLEKEGGIQDKVEAEKIAKDLNSEINPSNIVSAGKSIKKVVYAIVALIMCTMIGILIATVSRDFAIIQNTYIFLGLISLFFNIYILIQLFTAGNELVKSVKK